MAFWGPLSLQTPDDYVTQTPGYEQRRQQQTVYQPSNFARTRERTQLDPIEERQFQRWYGNQAILLGLNLNPDDPLHRYDYRGAYRAGMGPGYDPGSGEMHWPSQFKAENHPNRFVNGVDTRGQDMGGEGVRSSQGLSPQDVNTATLAEQGPATAGGGLGDVAGMVEGGDKENPSFKALTSAPSLVTSWQRLWPEWGGTR